MSSDADLMFRPAAELAGLVRRGDVTSRELVEASLTRIEALDGDVNAFVDVYAEDALATADTIGADDARPFAGVPVAVKNNRSVAGKRLTFAAELMGDFIAPADHNTVARLKAAGFVIVGATNLPEYGILPVTEPRRFGATRNPWDLSRTPGGSSGGSAAAVAAGMVPLAHGNDGGGSTRIPAACCGLVGLKPQRGRISLAPELGYQLLVQDGVLTRTVAETAQLLDVLAGTEVGDLAWAPPPPAPFAELAQRDPGALRVALVTTSPLEDAELDPVCERAVRDTATLLESLGHTVEEPADVPWAMPGVLHLFTAAFGPAVSLQTAFAGLISGKAPAAQDMEPLSWAVWQLCEGMNATQAALADAQLQGFARLITQWSSQWDVLLMPSLAEAPVPIGTIDACSEDPMRDFARSGRFTPYTAISNLTGSPAISLPLHVRPDDDAAAGLPLGIQLVGRPAQEGTLLALSAQLEAARPWADRRAAVS